MDILILICIFILMTGGAILFSNLLRLNLAEGMILSVFVIIVAAAVSVGLLGSYPVAILFLLLVAAGGLISGIYRVYKDGKAGIFTLLSPYFFALTGLFLMSLMMYRGDLIQNLEELKLWALADKYMCTYDQLYEYNGVPYLQGASLFRYMFLRGAGYQEGTLYAVSALLYWIGLLLPLGKVTWDKLPRFLVYILLMHIGLYSMYYYGTKTCAPELALACWTGGLAGWWITRERRKADILVLLAGLTVSFTFTTSMDALLILLLFLLAVIQLSGDLIRSREADKDEDPAGYPADSTDSAERTGHWLASDRGNMLVVLLSVALILFLYGFLTQFSYLQENLVTFLRCLVENNMTLGLSDLNYTLIFNTVLLMVLFIALVDRRAQRQTAIRYITYSIVAAGIYIAVLFYSIVDAEVHIEEDYQILIQRMLGLLVIYLFVMGLSWLFCEKRLLERKAVYIPGLVLLVVFLYGLNADYLTRTTAAYPEKGTYYAALQQVIRECEFLKSKVPSDKKIYLINQGDEIASAEARYLLGDQVSDYTSASWQYSVSGGMIGSEPAPYSTLQKLKSTLTKGKYSYVWIHKSDEYLSDRLPKTMGREAIEEALKEQYESESLTSTGETGEMTSGISGAATGTKTDLIALTDLKLPEHLLNSNEIAAGQLYKINFRKKKAWTLSLVRDIVPYETRKVYYRWNDLIID